MPIVVYDGNKGAVLGFIVQHVQELNNSFTVTVNIVGIPPDQTNPIWMIATHF